MKKISKLQINSERIINNEGLIALKGGYGGQCDYWCCVYYGSELMFCGVGCGESVFGPQADCNIFYGGGISCQCW